MTQPPHPSPSPSPASRLKVVLVRTRFPANIGSTARVCANFEVGALSVVTPERDWNVPEAQKLAVGNAERFLSSLRAVDSVQAAIGDATLAIGFTRREGEHRNQTLELADLATLIWNSRARQVALIFGNEETGLTDPELMACSHFVRIPTAPSLPSMNLSHAVALVVGRLYDELSRLEALPIGVHSGRVTATSPAPMPEMHGFFDHWRELLIQCGLTEAGNPDRMIRRLERFFYRAQPSLREVRLMRGLLSKIQYWVKKGRGV